MPSQPVVGVIVVKEAVYILGFIYPKLMEKTRAQRSKKSPVSPADPRWGPTPG